METVNLRIKSPSADYSDINLTVSVDGTVLDVKRLIEAEYASSPATDTQKLVYSGKLLNDTETLRDFIRFDDECPVYTIHLVCKLQPKQPELNASSTQDGLRNRLENVPIVNQPSVPEPVTDEGDFVAMRDMLANIVHGNLASGNLSADEMMNINQLQEQYTALYNQYMHSQYVQQGQVLVHQQGVQQPAQAQPAPDAAAAAPVEEQGNNDLLDYAYSVIRVLILVCVMYVHSSFFRLLFVAGGLLLAYLFQNRNRGEINNNNNVEPVNENLVVNDEPVGDDAVNDPEETANVVEPKPNVLVVAFTFVTSLITSILPEANHVI